MAKIYHVIQIKLKSVSSRKCPYDHRDINKAYSSAITVTNIYQRFTYKMAAKINRHRYGTKLSLSPYNWCSFLQSRHPSGQWSPWHFLMSRLKGTQKHWPKDSLGKSPTGTWFSCFTIHHYGRTLKQQCTACFKHSKFQPWYFATTSGSDHVN